MSDAATLRRQLAEFDFQSAFVDGGWNYPEHSEFRRVVRDREFVFQPIAEVGGIVAMEVMDGGADAPSIVSYEARNLRRSVDVEITREINQHILIFVDSDRTEGIWHFAKTVRGKRLHREFRVGSNTPIEPLVRLLHGMEVPYEWLDESGDLAHVAALDMMDQAGIYAEKVSKKFYDLLAKKRKIFEPFLNWVKDEEKRAWYVTVLLNRLMFMYFIQDQGLLGGSKKYLHERLSESRAKGTDRFYPDFFLPLCFFGFGRPAGERGRFEEQFEGVPYLNGGIFSVHQVEDECGATAEALQDSKLPADIAIPDSEFERWFSFFDDWQWTLDEVNPENERQINPDILGYIFEKYINQKQMGAYYTKEDITGYICRNTIIPRLFDMLAETGHKGKQAVEPLPIGPHPNLLNDGKGISQGEGVDRYIYPAVKALEYLPTETEREFDARQKRYESILQDFDDGKIASVNDFITWNLDMERMAADFISAIQDAEVLRDFYFSCLKKITILDPTCGSGAFLFAALKILFPLYRKCLDKMSAMCTGAPGGSGMTWKGEMELANQVDRQLAFMDSHPDTRKQILAQFHQELEEIGAHPNPDYFVYKTIIVNNLFGVDIMDEAVEICKLRLFLKLIAHAEQDENKANHGIEPLPNIDFNILAGNTLVGYTSFEDIDQQWRNVEVRRIEADDGTELGQGAMAFGKDHTRLRYLVGQYGADLRMFREYELGLRPGHRINMEQMAQTRAAAKTELDRDLWSLYKDAGKRSDRTTLLKFGHTHKPFHWFLEFPELMESGGFDSIVGNPPYVEYAKVTSEYRIHGYTTEECGNLYAFVMERAYRLLRPHGYFGMIVPTSLVGLDDTARLRHLLLTCSTDIYFSTYAIRPSKLFDGVDQRLCICVAKHGSLHEPTIWTTRYYHWHSEERASLFPKLEYVRSCVHPRLDRIIQTGNPVAAAVMRKLEVQSDGTVGSYYAAEDGHILNYHRSPRYWIRAMDFEQYFKSPTRNRSIHHFRTLRFSSPTVAKAAGALLNSSLFFFWFLSVGNGRNITGVDVAQFPLGTLDGHICEQLGATFDNLMLDYKANSFVRVRKDCEFQEFQPSISKPIIDEIDRALAKHYGFTEEELDFIINYDIKYRMGRDAEDAVE